MSHVMLLYISALRSCPIHERASARERETERERDCVRERRRERERETVREGGRERETVRVTREEGVCTERIREEGSSPLHLFKTAEAV